MICGINHDEDNRLIVNFETKQYSLTKLFKLFKLVHTSILSCIKVNRYLKIFLVLEFCVLLGENSRVKSIEF